MYQTSASTIGYFNFRLSFTYYFMGKAYSRLSEDQGSLNGACGR